MPPSRRLPALGHREFRTYLLGGFISNIGSGIQATAIFYHVYALTGSSFMVGMIGLVTVVPLVMFSLFAGVLADQHDRRKLMLVTQSGLALVALALFAAASSKSTSVLLIFALVAIGAMVRAFDGPARQPLVASLVPPTDLPNAFSLNGISWRLSDVLGPVLAGLMISLGNRTIPNGLALCYLVNFLTFFAVIYSVLKVAPRPSTVPPDERARSVSDVLTLIREGLAFVRKSPVIRSAMWIDFWATFFSGAEALVPAFALKLLHSDPTGFGLLAGSAATGAFIAAAILALLPPIRRQGAWVIAMIFAYGLSTILFGISTTLTSAMIFLAASGAADMISTVMRQTIRQLSTPDNMRGRMTATSFLFHATGPRLGDFEAGAMARFTGERASIVIGGAACMVVNCLWLGAKHLRNYEHDPEPTA